MQALVLVGGFMAPGLEWQWSPLRNEAESRGWTPVYHHRRLPFGPVATSADKLTDLVVSLRADHDRIVLVGHSMGGLVVERAARRVRVSAVVTLGTPHYGCPLIRLIPVTLPIPALQDMAEGSGFMRILHSEESDLPPILAVVGGRDRLVPGDQAIPHRAHTRYVAPRIGHAALIWSQSVARHVFDWLDETVAA